MVLLVSLAHQASPAALELRAIWACKVLKDLRVFKVREARLASLGLQVNVVLKVSLVKTVFPARRAPRDPKATLALLASLELVDPLDSLVVLASPAIKENEAWEVNEASRESLV